LRGLAKIGSSQPIFDWGSFLLLPQPFETGVALILPGDRKGRPYAQICKYHPLLNCLFIVSISIFLPAQAKQCLPWADKGAIMDGSLGHNPRKEAAFFGI
jgi:hypothetical protein